MWSVENICTLVYSLGIELLGLYAIARPNRDRALYSACEDIDRLTAERRSRAWSTVMWRSFKCQVEDDRKNSVATEGGPDPSLHLPMFSTNS
jgi:hypothetical protein